MIITKTPLRVSLFGGGTDYPEYFNEHPTTVINATIDKYVYVMLNPRHDSKVRVAYSQTEIVNHTADLQHDLIRESLNLCNITHGIEIATMADIPGQGSGLGSSSAVTVGVLKALFKYIGKNYSQGYLANKATEIEREHVKNGAGYQDQIAAEWGGLNIINFGTTKKTPYNGYWQEGNHKTTWGHKFLLFFTGTTRKAQYILQDMATNTADNLDRLHAIRLIAEEAAVIIKSGRDLDRIGPLLDRSWQLKKHFAKGVSNPEIDTMYEDARAAGATGGKICGAGGGGYMLLYCPSEEIRTAVRSALRYYKELPFNFSEKGSEVMYND